MILGTLAGSFLNPILAVVAITAFVLLPIALGVYARIVIASILAAVFDVAGILILSDMPLIMWFFVFKVLAGALWVLLYMSVRHGVARQLNDRHN